MIISSKELAESIRTCGVQIANDAEMIAGNFKRRKSLSINIYWDADTGMVPTIDIENSYRPTVSLEREIKADTEEMSDEEVNKQIL